MKVYKLLYGNFYYMIDDDGDIYTLVIGVPVKSSWSGTTEQFMKHVSLVGNNVKLK